MIVIDGLGVDPALAEIIGSLVGMGVTILTGVGLTMVLEEINKAIICSQIRNALKAGSTIDDLLEQGFTLDDILKSGASAEDLLRAGASPEDLLKAGFWTLEIQCIQPVKIYPMVEICQIYYHTLEDDFEGYNSGKYQNNTGIQPSLIYKDFERKQTK